jgi:putative phosphoribosyl transferase
MRFKDRVDAGAQLAQLLCKYKNKDVVVYGLPRGGVITAHTIAQYLNAPLDLIMVKKIGHPYSSEYALGAIAENGECIFNEADKGETDKQWLKDSIREAQRETKRRRQLYVGDRNRISAKNKTVILVDDGVATGLTMRVAIEAVKHQHPKQIIVAVPVCPKDFEYEVKKEGCELVALQSTDNFLGAVGAYYHYFPQVTDFEVIQIMKEYN